MVKLLYAYTDRLPRNPISGRSIHFAVDTSTSDVLRPSCATNVHEQLKKGLPNMLDIVVDVAQTFVGMMLRGCEPKMQRKDRDNQNSEMVPALDKAGVQKYTVYLS